MKTKNQYNLYLKDNGMLGVKEVKEIVGNV